MTQTLTKKQLLPTAKRNSKFITCPSFELLDGRESKFVSMFVAALSVFGLSVSFYLVTLIILPRTYAYTCWCKFCKTLTQITARCVVIDTS